MKHYATSTLGTACCTSCGMGGPCASHVHGALGFVPAMPAFEFDWKWLAAAVIAAYVLYREFFSDPSRRQVRHQKLGEARRRRYVRDVRAIREAA